MSTPEIDTVPVGFCVVAVKMPSHPVLDIVVSGAISVVTTTSVLNAVIVSAPEIVTVGVPLVSRTLEKSKTGSLTPDGIVNDNVESVLT